MSYLSLAQFLHALDIVIETFAVNILHHNIKVMRVFIKMAELSDIGMGEFG